MDVSPLLLPEEASYYHTVIGVLRWIVELGCVDIYVKVSQLSSFLAMQRKGHMVSALHIMYYLLGGRHKEVRIRGTGHDPTSLEHQKGEGQITVDGVLNIEI